VYEYGHLNGKILMNSLKFSVDDAQNNKNNNMCMLDKQNKHKENISISLTRRANDISDRPYKSLNAPSLSNDFYTNVLTCSSKIYIGSFSTFEKSILLPM